MQVDVDRLITFAHQRKKHNKSASAPLFLTFQIDTDNINQFATECGPA